MNRFCQFPITISEGYRQLLRCNHAIAFRGLQLHSREPIDITLVNAGEDRAGYLDFIIGLKSIDSNVLFQ